LKFWLPDAAAETAFADMPPVEDVVDGRYGSSSNSRSLPKILLSYLYRSSSSTWVSGIINVRFLLTKLLVPTLPDIAQSMPFHCLLKLD
jgi:hypothetical protein